jgi:peptide/nickel transport system permease protein
LPGQGAPTACRALSRAPLTYHTESSLSFLGLGFSPDTPSWGRMLFEARSFIEFNPTMTLFPGLCIFLNVLSIN